jgi:chaperone required for assembly of F1-ATPase
MTRQNVSRLYESASSEPMDGGFVVILDGRRVQTPGGAQLCLPTASLAAAIADEWSSQSKKIKPATMPMTQLACTTIDLVRPERAMIQATITGYADSDLLCYRADQPADLVAAQEAAWGPLLEWAETSCSARLIPITGVVHVSQSADTIAALSVVIAAHDDFQMTALAEIVQISGSLVIGLAVLAGYLSVEQGIVAAFVDETFQAGRWGVDKEAMNVRQSRRDDLIAAAAFLDHLD